MNDVAKLAMFDDLQATVEALREENGLLREALERNEKRFSAMAWSLECLVRIAKDLPEPKEVEEPKMAKKRDRHNHV